MVPLLSDSRSIHGGSPLLSMIRMQMNPRMNRGTISARKGFILINPKTFHQRIESFVFRGMEISHNAKSFHLQELLKLVSKELTISFCQQPLIALRFGWLSFQVNIQLLGLAPKAPLAHKTTSLFLGCVLKTKGFLVFLFLEKKKIIPIFILDHMFLKNF